MRIRISIELWKARILALATAGAVAACEGGVSVTPEACSTAGAVAACDGGGGATPEGFDGGGGATPEACNNPKPVLIDGQETGYVACENGPVHRESIHACPPGPSADGGGADPGSCTQDADCGDASICYCSGTGGECVSASCKSDADCSDGGHCSIYDKDPYILMGVGCGAKVGFACQTKADMCEVGSDCPFEGSARFCTYDGGKRVCVSLICGRPFLVEGKARVAAVVRRGDWRAMGVTPGLEGISSDERSVLAQEWTRSGEMEHASIAAFARFAMQLLAVGAPPDMVFATQAAIGDETEHARLCFALASAYAGTPVGPGRLAIEGALCEADGASILRLVIEEGCVGETAAAIEAAEVREHAEDPVVRAVLSKIADDEGRHAELAWRYVRWAVERDASLRAVAERTFADVIEHARAEAGEAVRESDARWLPLGAARGSVKRAIRERVIECVIAPAAKALLAATNSPKERVSGLSM